MKIRGIMKADARNHRVDLIPMKIGVQSVGTEAHFYAVTTAQKSSI